MSSNTLILLASLTLRIYTSDHCSPLQCWNSAPPVRNTNVPPHHQDVPLSVVVTSYGHQNSKQDQIRKQTWQPEGNVAITKRGTSCFWGETFVYLTTGAESWHYRGSHLSGFNLKQQYPQVAAGISQQNWSEAGKCMWDCDQGCLTKSHYKLRLDKG